MSKLNNIVMFACSEGRHFSQMMALHELFGKHDSILVTDNVRATKKMHCDAKLVMKLKQNAFGCIFSCIWTEECT